jgi:hypothetical protein
LRDRAKIDVESIGASMSFEITWHGESCHHVIVRRTDRAGNTPAQLSTRRSTWRSGPILGAGRTVANGIDRRAKNIAPDLGDYLNAGVATRRRVYSGRTACLGQRSSARGPQWVVGKRSLTQAACTTQSCRREQKSGVDEGSPSRTWLFATCDTARTFAGVICWTDRYGAAAAAARGTRNPRADCREAKGIRRWGT